MTTTQRPAERPTERPAAVQRAGLAVPWSTVVPLAAVMAFADGFWMTSLRGAVGAIETTQSPFASWWRESTVILPVFVFAVLAVLTLALRWFGPVLVRQRTVLVTALLIVAAGTVVGLGEIVAGAAYDYHLQSNQLRLMDAMQTMCTGNCLPQQLHDTLAVHVRAVLYVSRWLLLTNLGLVAWLVAMRGGRVKLSTTRAPRDHRSDTPHPTGSRVKDLRLLLVAALLAAAAIHAAVIPGQLREWTAAAVFFIVLTTAELATAAMLLARPEQRVALHAARIITTVALLVWLYSRTAGMPFGPHAGIPEGIGLADAAAGALQLAALFAAVVLLRASGPVQRRAPASAHVKGLTVVALIAVTAIGLTGTGLSWFNNFGLSASQSGIPEMIMPH
jgi:hypothetical protein